jgi:acid phosphatase
MMGGMGRIVRFITALLTVALVAGGCASERAGANAREVTTGSAPAATVTKLLVVVMENHSLSQMQGGMPYTFGLAKRYGYATDYHAITHPSLPNYLAITGGSTYGVRDDKPPAAHRLTGRSVFGQARAHGRTAATYAESMTSACARSNDGRYAVRHNPWTYFARERRGCRAGDHALPAFTRAVRGGTLPRVGMLVPNVCHDAHDCDLATADAWFQARMTQVFAGPDWKAGRLAVVLTADEDDRASGNVVLTVVIHPSQDHHVVTTRLTHYSLTRLYDEVAGLPYLRKAASAPSMARAFGLPVG